MLFNVKEAVEFYGLTNPEYLEKCEKAANEVEESEEYVKVFKKFSSALFGHTLEERTAYRTAENKQALFGFDIPFFTNLILLSGYEFHDRMMKEQKYEDLLIEYQKNRIKQILSSEVSVGMTFWTANYINGELLEYGRLQYQNKKTSIGIHIPGGSPLKIEEVKKSLDASKELIKKYFGITDENIKYECISWILSPELGDLLPEKSNMREFRKLFEITGGVNYNPTVVSSIFHSSETDYTKLSENTSLQKSVKKFLVDGGVFHRGIGELNYFNKK